MSLARHVAPFEDNDREEPLVDLFLPPVERGAASLLSERRLSNHSAAPASAPARSIRKQLSYDAFAPPDEIHHEHGGVTPYNVPAARRVGRLNPIWPYLYPCR